ncbi:MAG TPA: hypothetical protein PKY35_09645 [Candidatus Hydrogenedentes bacterium]|nr:hypothetical protein [Candidatus Hydrogenedentota bacterium]HOL77281.1 hypothetical protein [Candidatus Hydrogenedentota bacterium]HPO85924.1 hypothetical protein [Candidatus Hydrogenedentota bacterium]
MSSLIRECPRALGGKPKRVWTVLFCCCLTFAASTDDSEKSNPSGNVFQGGKIQIRQNPTPKEQTPSAPVTRTQKDTVFSLDEFFGAPIETLDYDQLLTLASTYVESQTLQGIPPTTAWQTLENKMKASSRTALSPSARTLLALVKNIFAWQELEAAFTTDPSGNALRRSVAVVKDQAAIDPQFDNERLKRILETIETKGLFVPSSILFRRFVIPYRPMRIPSESYLLEIPVKPEYQDAEHEVRATLDFLAPFAPVHRIDFDTVGTAEIRVDKSVDGKKYEKVQSWTTQRRGGIRGPVFLQPPQKTRFLTLTAIAPAETAVLRNIRIFAIKESPLAVCPKSSVPPLLDADFKESCWPREPQVDGFVLNTEPAFAEAQTTVRLIHDGETLYLAAYLREPRMATRVTLPRQRDASLDDDESFEIVFVFSDDVRYRFAINASGTQSDSRNNDPTWDAAWRVITKDYPLGWAAEIAIPFQAFEGRMLPGTTCAANFIRTRKNVVTERSSWAFSATAEKETFGKVLLD